MWQCTGDSLKSYKGMYNTYIYIYKIIYDKAYLIIGKSQTIHGNEQDLVLYRHHVLFSTLKISQMILKFLN